MGRRVLTPEQREEGRRLAERLRRAREEVGRDQADVARTCGVPLDTLRKLERNGIPTPSFMTVARLARDLKLGLEEVAEDAFGKGIESPHYAARG